ncbi:MAG: methylated-DNA--[protein]-cysteine S-methyltransferase [Acetivibrionales bacterium]|jgi:methylated-DNA-[protein]-cysteine S-methyltransferase
MNSVFYYKTCVGVIGIADNGKAITGLFFAGDGRLNPDVSGSLKETPLIREAAFQLSEYFAGKRKAFDIPLDMKGTPFQLAVWKALSGIPYGETSSYKEISESIGRARAYRAVGMACNRNPVAIIVPCHRVIGSDGSMTGFASGVGIKEKLLELEKRYSNHRTGTNPNGGGNSNES